MYILRGHIALSQQEDAPAFCIFSNIEDNHSMAWRPSFYEDIAGNYLIDVFGKQLLLQRSGTAVGEYLCEISIESGATGGIGMMVCPFEKVEADTLFGVEFNTVEVVSGITIFRAEPHDGIGTLLEIGLAHGDIQHRELSLLVLLTGAIVEIDGAILFEGKVSKPGSKGIMIGWQTVIAGRDRDSSDQGVRIGLIRGAKQTGQRGVKQGFHTGKKPVLILSIQMIC